MQTVAEEQVARQDEQKTQKGQKSQLPCVAAANEIQEGIVLKQSDGHHIGK